MSEHYYRRLRAVLEYIDAHLEQDLSTEHLADIAAFSKYHFHRQFSTLFGMSLSRYIQLVRLKRAAYQLAFREQQSVINVALSSSYEGPETFARAFKKHTNQAPSEFRRQPQWQSWYANIESLRELRIKHMNTSYADEHVNIVDFPQTRIAVFEHCGDPIFIGDSIRKFIVWRKTQQLSPRVSDTFNILYDNPFDTEPDKFRLDLCVAANRDRSDVAAGIVMKSIPAGRCARLRHVGNEESFAEALKFLYAEWLPRSNEELRDFPLFCQRIRFFPDVLEHEAVTDIFLPLR